MLSAVNIKIIEAVDEENVVKCFIQLMPKNKKGGSRFYFRP
jgi:hypothetical protein